MQILLRKLAATQCLATLQNFCSHAHRLKAGISSSGEFIHPLELPSAYYVSDTVLSTEDKAFHKRTKITALWTYILLEMRI